MTRFQAAGLLGLAFLTLAPVAAMAADVPGGPGTKATVKVTPTRTQGTHEIANDSDWYRVALQAGQNYGFEIESGSGALIRLRDEDGKLLGRAADGVEADGGFEHLITRTGTYFVEIVDRGFADSYPNSYGFAVTKDCGAKPKTACTVASGGTLTSRMDWSYDEDLIKVALLRAKAYTFHLAAGSDPVEVKLLDPDHRPVFSVPGTRDIEIPGVKVPKNGTYTIVVSGIVDFPVDYKVGLTQP